MDNGRRSRIMHLNPLIKMTLPELIWCIEEMSKRKATAVMKAMHSCSQTNCGWDIYALAKRFRCDVQARLNRLLSEKKESQ